MNCDLMATFCKSKNYKFIRTSETQSQSCTFSKKEKDDGHLLYFISRSVLQSCMHIGYVLINNQ